VPPVLALVGVVAAVAGLGGRFRDSLCTRAVCPARMAPRRPS